MKTIVLFFTLLIITGSTMAQEFDSWKIYHNRKEVSSFSDKEQTDDERKVVLLKRFLEGPGFVIFEIKPASAQADWLRTIAFYDKDDKLIREFKNTLLLRLHNSEVDEIMENKTAVKVYSWAIPKDPEKAATVRVRRILLCTLYTR